MMVTFGEHPPVYSVRKDQTSATPYPTGCKYIYLLHLYIYLILIHLVILAFMPQPGGTSNQNTAAASGGSYFPYPTEFPRYPTSNNFGGYPPYPSSSGNAMPGTTSGGGTGYPPYMNFPPVPGYNSGYVSN